ncbi:hypothetical protein ACG7TL_008787 [Trametes sanguinea]
MPLHGTPSGPDVISLPASTSQPDADATLASFPDLVTPLPNSDKPLPIPSSSELDPDPLVRWSIPASLLAKFPSSDLLDLTTGNYCTWQRRIHDVLIVVGDLLKHLDLAYVSPPCDSRLLDARTWLLNDQHVHGFLRLQCSDDELEVVCAAVPSPTSAAALWDFLRCRHLNRGPHAQVLLLRDLLQLQFDVSKPLVPQTHHAISMCRQILAMGTLSSDSLAKVAVLHMMRDVLPGLQCAIAQDLIRATPSTPYSIADIVKHVEMEQGLRREERPSTLPHGLSTDVALAATGRIVTICGTCKRKGHNAADCYQPGGAMEGTRTLFDTSGKAYLVTDAVPAPPALTETAHAAVASSLVADHVEPNSSPAWLETLAAEGDSYFDTALVTLPVKSWDDIVTLDQGLALSALPSQPFFFDSGATSHISPHRDDFSELTPIPPRGICGIDGSVILATAMGTIRLPVGPTDSLTPVHALYVPRATVRLISVRALCENPAVVSVAFTSTGVSICRPDGSEFVAGSRLANSPLYALDSSPMPTAHALIASRVPTLATWHRRLGHANYKATFAIASRAKATGSAVDLVTVPPKCDSCILGKQTRTPVPKVREGIRSAERGATFFVDAAGSQCTRSASGNVCALDIIDDYSSYSWTFPLPSKGHCGPALRAFIIARRAEGCPVRRIVMDNGECLTSDIIALCNELGVAYDLTAPYTSAHNGKVERVHRTYHGKSRAMRISAGIPEDRWDELYCTACYLTNHTPSSSLPSGITPYEAWFGRAPSLSHLREIGSRAFVLINTHNPKLHARSIECILLGYGSNSKTYRCYHPASCRVLSSYHISFIESHEDHLPVSVPPSAAPVPSTSSALPPPVWDDDPIFVPSLPHSAPPVPPNLLSPTPLSSPPVSVSLSEPSPTPVPSLLISTPSPDTVLPPSSPVSHDHVTVSSLSSPRPARARKPSERFAAAHGLDYTTDLERAVAEIRANSAHVQAAQASAAAARSDLVSARSSPLDVALAASLQLDSAYDGDPPTYAAAMASPFASQWHAALLEEFRFIRDLGVYRLVPRSAVPPGRRIMHGKPVFRLKHDELGRPVRFKARWVCKGYEAVWGQDYHRTTSPTMRMESFRVLLHLAASLDWSLLQLDIKTVFLYGVLPDDEVCYMEQPPGFEDTAHPTHVWELVKGLYGLPHGGRNWYLTMHNYITSKGFSRVSCEYCLYARTSAAGTVIFGVHVDDFLGIASTPAAAAVFKADLRAAWSISDLGEARFCIGIAIDRDRSRRTIRISQTALIDRVIAQFGLATAAPVSTPMESGLKLSRTHGPGAPVADSRPYRALVGSLNYIAVGSRPDISFAVQQLAQFLDCFGDAHWEAAKRVIQYLKGTRSLALELGGTRIACLLGYFDSDWARCPDTRRSIGGYCFSLGSGMISWAARKQATTADSSTEAEYIAAAEAAKECVWLRAILAAIGFPQSHPSSLSVDNSGAVQLSSDPSFHSRSKHIDIKHHLLRDYVNDGRLIVHWIPTKDNTADIFTKPLPGPQFSLLRGFLGLR